MVEGTLPISSLNQVANDLQTSVDLLGDCVGDDPVFIASECIKMATGGRRGLRAPNRPSAGFLGLVSVSNPAGQQGKLDDANWHYFYSHDEPMTRTG